MRTIEKLKNNCAYWLLILIVLLFGVMMAALYSVHVVTDGLVFSLYTLLGMILPGYALVRLLHIPCESDVELVTYTIFFGYFVSFFEYFFIVPFGIQKLAPLVWLAFSLISAAYLLYLCKKKKLICHFNKDKFGMCACICLLCLVIFVRCGLYAGENLLPYGNVQLSTMYEDILYWIGNSISLAKSFPPKNFRNVFTPFNYHYFTSIQIAMMSLSTKISVMLVSVCFSYIYPSAMLVFAGYSVFSKCNKNNMLRLLASVGFLFASGFSDFTDSRYAGYMYEYPFAFDYGMAIFVFLTFLVMREFYKEKMAAKDAIVIVVFFGLLCGVKANFAAVALTGIGAVCLRWMFHKNQRKKAVVIGLTTLLLFILVYFLVTNIAGYRPDALTFSFTSNLLTNSSEYGSGRVCALYESLLNRNIPTFLSLLVILLIFTLASNPLFFGISFIQIIRNGLKREKLADGSLILMLMVMVGVLLRVFIGLYGWSEQYFLYNVFPVGGMFMLLNWKTELNFNTFINKLKYAGVVTLLIVGVWGFVKYDERYSFFEDMINGYSRYAGSEYVVEDYYSRFNKEQFEAYEWLRDNTESNDYFTANAYDYRRDMGCVAERYNVYTPMSETFFCANSTEEACSTVEDLKRIGIKWVVNINEFGKMSDQVAESSECYEKVFENSEVTIFKIL